MMVFARQRLTVAQLEYMQKHITIVAAEGVIDYYHVGCAEEAKQSFANALTKNVNDDITQYTNAIGLPMQHLRRNSKLNSQILFLVPVET